MYMFFMYVCNSRFSRWVNTATRISKKIQTYTYNKYICELTIGTSVAIELNFILLVAKNLYRAKNGAKFCLKFFWSF